MPENYQKSLFDKTFKDRGGLFQTEKLSKDSFAIFEYYRTRAIKYIESGRNHESLIKSLPNIHFDFIDSPDFNAVAAKTNDGFYFIGINAGSVVVLYDLFFRMLSNPLVLNDIGNSSLETKNTPTIRNYYLDASLLVTYGDIDYNAYQMAIPNDHVRQVYARHLVDVAVDFLIAHELTHIINGHLDYIQTRFGTNIYEERNIKTISEDDILTIQTLEMDADSLAVCKGLANAVKRHLGEQSVSEDRKEFYVDFDRTIFNWSIAILTLTRIMVESSIYRSIDSKPKTHPHPRIRQTMILATVDEYLKTYYPKQYELFSKDIYGELAISVEMTYKYITGNIIDGEEYLRAIDNSEKYVPRLLEHWNIIKNDLSDKTFVELVK